MLLALFIVLATTLPLAAEPVPPALLLAERYRGDVDVARYWVSEKLDGIRASWDGKNLRFRSGEPVPAPRWFLDALPRQPLDSELWLGRRSFDQLSTIVRSQSPDDTEWRWVRYMIFELPDASGSLTDRIEQIRLVTATANLPWLQATPQFRQPDAAALQEKMRDIVRGSGEGLMLHRDDALYETGRSSALLKVTPMARRRGQRRRPFAGHRQVRPQSRRFADAVARRLLFRIGQRFDRCAAPRSATGR